MHKSRLAMRARRTKSGIKQRFKHSQHEGMIVLFSHKSGICH